MKQTTWNELIVTSEAFENEGIIPVQYTGRGKDISPPLKLSLIQPEAKSMAIIMDDLDIPLIDRYNHWVIWNIPVQNIVEENIPAGDILPGLGGAIQGIGYGKHRYRGPKPPFFIRNYHRYQFHVYILDCTLELGTSAGKKDLLKAMDGHVLQYGSIMGKFRNK